MEQQTGSAGESSSVDSPPLHRAKILYVDIETSPNIADVWGMWDQNVSLNQLRESTRIIGFAYRWQGGPKARWVGEYHRPTGELSKHREMLEAAWKLYDETDIVVTYNGNRFDNLHFNTEWACEGMTPPSPVLSLDLFATVKRQFKFPSNKLAYVAERLVGDTKVVHSGHVLWSQCLNPDVDPKVRSRAWSMMSKYARQDVDLLEPIHHRLMPWLPNTINVSIFGNDGEDPACGKCGSADLKRRGFAYTASKRYQRYVCRACGAWARGTARLMGVTR